MKLTTLFASGDLVRPIRRHRSFPADRELRNTDRGLRISHRRALPVLAAGTVRKAEIVSHAIDDRNHLGPIADERGTANWRAQFSVLDQIALGHSEHEIAGYRVYLTSSHRLYENAHLR